VIFLVDFVYNAIVLPVLRLWLWSGSLIDGKLQERAANEVSAFVSASEFTCSGRRIWFHAASMGEFEQCIPVIGAVRELLPGATIIATFTSPSGYRHVARSGIADVVLYLPLDTKANAIRFFDALRPDVGVVVRYDLWRNHLLEARSRRIPIHVINATVPAMARFRFLRGWIGALYRSAATLTAMTPNDAAELRSIVEHDVAYLPDTRYDRILQRIASPDPSILRLRRQDRVTVVLGSSWQQDEELFLAALLQMADARLRCIIVPHEPTPSHVCKLRSMLNATLMSEVFEPTTTEHIIVDSVGSLLSLYAIADAAYVGGGFGAGVHSLAEPAGYGLALACGPHIQRSRDADALVEADALTVVQTTAEIVTWLRTSVLDPIARHDVGHRAESMVVTRSGSSKRCASLIVESLS